MKKRLLFLILMVFSLMFKGQSRATPIYMDIGPLNSGVDYNGDGDTVTGIHDQWVFFSKTKTTINAGNDGITIGDTFTDEGSLYVTYLQGTFDTEGLNQNSSLIQGYEITAYWDNIQGKVTDVQQNQIDPTKLDIDTIYTGGTISFYFDHPPALAGAYPAYNAAEAHDGIQFMTAEVISGTGHIDERDQNGHVYLTAKINSIADNVLFFGTSNLDFHELIGQEIVLGFVDENINHFVYNYNDYPPTIYAFSDHDGSIEFAVPEPATLFLFGSGLFGLAGIGRRRMKG